MEDRSVLVDELNFFFGVCNVMFSSWLAGAFPFGYWIYHSIKIFILMIIRLVDFSSRKQQFWLLDYCYVVNYLILLYYLLSIAGVCPWPKVVFRILFTSCVGPLALSVAAFRNSLVFHSSKNIVILAVHFSPNVALWGMRWFPHQLDNSFPGVFDICGSDPPRHPNLFFSNSDCPGSFLDLYLWPVFTYAILWATPYYLFFFAVGKRALRRGGYFTMFDDMSQKPAVARVLALGGNWGKEIKYMCCHGFLCYCAFFMGPLLWHSFILHSIYLVFIMAVAVYNGGTFYFRVFARKYYKDLIQQAAVEEESEDGEHDLAIVIPSPSVSSRYDGEEAGISTWTRQNSAVTREQSRSSTPATPPAAAMSARPITAPAATVDNDKETNPETVR